MKLLATVSGLCLAFGMTHAALAADAKPAAKTAYKAPRTVGGQPDLQGNWSNASLTTLERNAATYGDRLVMTPQEVAKAEGAEADARAAGNAPTDPNLKVSDLPVDCGRGFTGVNCGYNSGWVDPGSTVMRVHGEPRTSFITSTANGRIPSTKPGVTFSRGAALRPGMSRDDNPETRSLGERCLMSFGQSTGPVMLPQLYNNTYQFVQSKDALAINVEMVHDTRIVRLNQPHRTDGVRPWMGDSIGHWEGDTLVVETTNFPRQQAMRGVSWENLKVTEKFTRVADDRLLYQFTVEDPTVWDKPWGGEYEFAASNGGVYEYACHEGNYALEGILAGARNDERIAAAKAAGETAVTRPVPAGRSDR
jgi:hypothetical protein